MSHLRNLRIREPKDGGARRDVPVGLFKAVVGRFLCDDHIVDVAFTKPRRGGSNKPTLVLKFFNT